MALLALLVVVGTIWLIPARRDDPTLAAAHAVAVAKYPDLGVAGSAFQRVFQTEVSRLKVSSPEVFDTMHWPLQLADRLAPPSSSVSGNVRTVREDGVILVSRDHALNYIRAGTGELGQWVSFPRVYYCGQQTIRAALGSTQECRIYSVRVSDALDAKTTGVLPNVSGE